MLNIRKGSSQGYITEWLNEKRKKPSTQLDSNLRPLGYMVCCPKTDAHCTKAVILMYVWHYEGQELIVVNGNPKAKSPVVHPSGLDIVS